MEEMVFIVFCPEMSFFYKKPESKYFGLQVLQSVSQPPTTCKSTDMTPSQYNFVKAGSRPDLTRGPQLADF